MNDDTRTTPPAPTGPRSRATTTTARTLLAAALVATTLSATACQSEPAPAPASSQPTTTPTQSREQVAYTDAEAAQRNYTEVSDQVAQDYYRGWQEKMLPLTSESVHQEVIEYFSEGENGGYHQVGDTVISSVEAWGYEEEDHAAGRETVELRVCIDSSGVQDLSPDGINMLGEGTTGRFFFVVSMKHEPELNENGVPLPDTDDPYNQSWWRGAGSTTDYETC